MSHILPSHHKSNLFSYVTNLFQYRFLCQDTLVGKVALWHGSKTNDFKQINDIYKNCKNSYSFRIVLKTKLFQIINTQSVNKIIKKKSGKL